MEDERVVQLEQLKARVRRADYDVDADRVAEAILRRLMVPSRDLPPYGGEWPDAPPLRKAGPAAPPLLSDDVLESG